MSNGGANRWWKRNGFWIRWAFPVVGLASLVWFLVRVVPKPTRAAYPCQRVAGSLAGRFLVWIAGAIGSVFAYRRGKQLFAYSRLGKAALCFAVAAVAGIIAIERTPERWADAADGLPVNVPIGEARGIFPGRVVWVHDPNATNWTDSGATPYWYESQCTDQTVVTQMLEDTILALAGRDNLADAWDAIFRYYNIERGKGDVGYVAGEKIGIKINMTTCNAGHESPSHTKSSSRLGWIDNSPQMTIALLEQLANEVGVDPCDISIGDPTCMTPNYWYNRVQGQFPNVQYFDQLGGEGRIRVEYSPVEFYWSTPAAVGTRQDYVPDHFAEAEYFINFAVLKGHSSGITLCGKNNYGSLIRMPTGWERDLVHSHAEGSNGYYSMHYSLPNNISGWSPGTGHYRAIVDLMGHEELGGKTLLYLIDGLYAGYYWDSRPRKWTSAPFNNDWPSSVFASLDPVAIDSVAYDFLLEEWPRVTTGGTGPMGDLGGGGEDYLHEAALANDPCSGTFYDPDHAGDVVRLESLGVHEHWNNAGDKEYSRDLGTGDGIELYIPSEHPPPVIPACWTYLTQCHGDADGSGAVDTVDWPVFRDAFGSAFPAAKYHPCADMDRDGDVDTVDWPEFRDNFGYPAAADCGPGGVWPPL